MKILFGGTVLPNNTQFGETVPPNNMQFGYLDIDMDIFKIYHVWYHWTGLEQ
jgi:hypothetical protein